MRRCEGARGISRGQCQEGAGVITPGPSCHNQHTDEEQQQCNTKGWIGNKSCLVTVNTRASMSIARPNITIGLPDRQQTWPYVLQMTSGETLLVLIDTVRAGPGMASCTDLGVHSLIDKFILGLVLHAYDVSMDLEGCVL